MFKRIAIVALMALASGLAVVSTPTVARADACDEIIVVTQDGAGIGSQAGSVQCGPGSSGGGSGGGGGSGAACSYLAVTAVVEGYPFGWMSHTGVIGVEPGTSLIGLADMNWYLQRCPDGSYDYIAVPLGTAIVGGAVVTPQELAIWARNHMSLPKPQVSFNPRQPSTGGPATLVGIPTWWWVTNWSEKSNHTEAGPVWVDVTATPAFSKLEPGDGGAPKICNGPGVAWLDSLSESDPRACTYTYKVSSAGMPDDHYLARLDVVWRIRWVGSGGTSGALADITVTATQPIAAMEREALVTNSHG